MLQIHSDECFYTVNTVIEIIQVLVVTLNSMMKNIAVSEIVWKCHSAGWLKNNNFKGKWTVLQKNLFHMTCYNINMQLIVAFDDCLLVCVC